MEKFEIVVPTIFGLEAFTSREIRNLGYETRSVEDGRVCFLGDMEAVFKSNLWIRTGERVLIKIAEFQATTFDELFEGTKNIRWSDWIGKDCKFPVTGYSIKSKLASVPDCQSIIKKAIVDSLSESYSINYFEETGVLYQIRFSIFKDRVTIMIDSSGEPLHKRGYRAVSNQAPLKETIAAAMILMSHWKYEYPLADPLCGSGTIPIEAAMIKRNIAPGLMRNFAVESFLQTDKELWAKCIEEAKDLKRDVELKIFASDIDKKTVEIAKRNAYLAGVADCIEPVVLDVKNFSSDIPYGTIISNPPYGERLGDQKQCKELYRDMGKVFSKLDSWSYYILTSNEDFENSFAKNANKKRKIYNGMLKCNIYQYFGPKPPKVNNN